MDQPKTIRGSVGHKTTRPKKSALIAQAQDKSSKRSYRQIKNKKQTKKCLEEREGSTYIYTHGHWLDRAFDDHRKNQNQGKAAEERAKQRKSKIK